MYLILRSERSERLEGWQQAQRLPPWFETPRFRAAPHHEGHKRRSLGP